MSTQVQLHDDDRLQLKGDAGHWQTVGSLRAAGYSEGELEVAADWGSVERRGECHTVRELRALSSPASVEQLRAFERELRRRDSGFIGITSTNDNLGTGTYETRTPAGQTAPKPFTFTGSVITTPTFAASINAGGPLKD